MINDSILQRMRTASSPDYVPKDTSTVLDLSGLDIDQLAQLRQEIDELLPTTKKLDLDRELSTQYVVIKTYQNKILTELVDEVPPNQVAQVMNSVVAALGQVIKLQENLDRIETFKKMETCLIEAVTLLPEDAKNKFFEEYETLAMGKTLA